METGATAKTAISAGHGSHDSPEVHRVGVKHENAENSIDISKTNNSLSIFLPFTRTPAQVARPRIREGRGERGNLPPMVPSPASERKTAVGTAAGGQRVCLACRSPLGVRVNAHTTRLGPPWRDRRTGW